eukprot:COSAG05_NODE_8197_length_727_cov_1.143312_1_plen_41_part_10
MTDLGLRHGRQDYSAHVRGYTDPHFAVTKNLKVQFLFDHHP